MLFPGPTCPGSQMEQGSTPLKPEKPVVQCGMQSLTVVFPMPVVFEFSGQGVHSANPNQL